MAPKNNAIGPTPELSRPRIFAAHRRMKEKLEFGQLAPRTALETLGQRSAGSMPIGPNESRFVTS
jgi:hypothetical protein